MASREGRLIANGIVLGVVIALGPAWIVLPTVPRVDCGARSGGDTPLGAALAFGSVSEGVVGSNHWYNSSIESAAGGFSSTI
jgi:hypothetical protein